MHDYTDNELNSASKAIRAIRKEITKLQNNIQTAVLSDFHILFFSGLHAIQTYLDRVEINRNINVQIINSTSDASFILDHDFNIIRWNKSAEKLYGCSDIQLQNKPFSELLRDPTAFSSIQAALDKYPSWEGEQFHTTQKNTQITVHATWAKSQGLVMEQAAYIVICKDLTQYKKLQAQLLQSQRLESVGLLTTGIAHDLNNVLTPIFLGVKVLQSELKDDKHKQILSLIESSAKRGESLVKQILNYTAGRTAQAEKTDVQDLVQEITQLFVSSLPKDIAFKVAVPENIDMLLGSKTSYFQILLNLCLNAKDAVEGKGNIDIIFNNKALLEKHETQFCTLKPGQYVQICISDSGKGINQDILSRIFDPFFSTKGSSQQGTGLGLSTVQTLIQNLNGGVEVVSESNKGTSFILHFPAAL